jgi:hypothetical protein
VAQYLTFLHNRDVPYMLRIHYAMFAGEASEMSASRFGETFTNHCIAKSRIGHYKTSDQSAYYNSV